MKVAYLETGDDIELDKRLRKAIVGYIVERCSHDGSRTWLESGRKTDNVFVSDLRQALWKKARANGLSIRSISFF